MTIENYHNSHYFYFSIINRADNLPLESSFQCAVAALRTLRGPGASLQMDDSEYVAYVYKLLPRLVTCTLMQQDQVVPVAMESLREAFVVRREHSIPRAAAFVKRMLTVATTLVRSEHTLAMLSFARLISNRYGALSQLADSGEDRVLSSAYLPYVDDPDQCNALGKKFTQIFFVLLHKNTQSLIFNLHINKSFKIFLFYLHINKSFKIFLFYLQVHQYGRQLQ
jgi:hypothetical protein